MALRVVQTSLVLAAIGVGVGVFNELAATDNVRVNRWLERIKPRPESFERDEKLAHAFYDIQTFRAYDEEAFVEALEAANNISFLFLKLYSHEYKIDAEADDAAVRDQWARCCAALDQLMFAVQESQREKFTLREDAKRAYERDLREYQSEMETIKRNFRMHAHQHHVSSVPSLDDDEDDDEKKPATAPLDEQHLLPTRPAPLPPKHVSLRYDEIVNHVYVAKDRLIRRVNYIRSRAREEQDAVRKRARASAAVETAAAAAASNSSTGTESKQETK